MAAVTWPGDAELNHLQWVYRKKRSALHTKYLQKLKLSYTEHIHCCTLSVQAAFARSGSLIMWLLHVLDNLSPTKADMISNVNSEFASLGKPHLVCWTRGSHHNISCTSICNDNFDPATLLVKEKGCVWSYTSLFIKGSSLQKAQSNKLQGKNQVIKAWFTSWSLSQMEEVQSTLWWQPLAKQYPNIGHYGAIVTV